MKRRMLSSLVIFSLFFSLLVPVQAETAAESVESSVKIATQGEEALIEEPQALPLPEAIAPEANNSVIAASSSSGIEIQNSDGTTVLSGGSFYYIVGDNVKSGYADIQGGKVLNLPKFDADIRVKGFVVLYQYDNSARIMKLRFDEKTMTGAELAELQIWKLDASAVETPIVDSLTTQWANRSYTLNYRDNYLTLTPPTPTGYTLSVIMPPDRLALFASGSSEGTGYLVRKSFDIDGTSTAVLDNGALDDTVVVQLPGTQTYTYVRYNPSAVSANLNNVSQLRLAKGQYNLTIQASKEGYVYQWSANQLEIQSDRTLNLEKPQISVKYMQAGPNELHANLAVRDGDWQLNYLSKDTKAVKVHATLSNSAGNKVYESDSDWSTLTAQFDPPLKSDTYALSLSLDYPGSLQPIVATSRMVIYNPADTQGKGLHVSAQDEAGNSLHEGHVYLYQKDPAPIYDGDQAGVYTSVRVYDDNLSGDGTLTIPYANLLKGKAYELVVIGSSSSADTPVLYSRSVSRDDTDVRFEGTGLKKTTFHADQAQSGDPLVVSLVDGNHALVGYPLTIAFSGQEASMWVQAPSGLDLFTKLTNNGTGYFLHKQVTAGSLGTSITLNGEMVQLSLPATYSGDIDVNYDWLPVRDPAHSYWISKGTDTQVYFNIEKDGFTYSFTKYAGVLNTDLNLDVGVNLKTKESVWGQAGTVNQRVYTNYWDTQDNLLYDVSMSSVRSLVDSSLSPSIKFKAISEGEPTFLSVERDSSGYHYADTQPKVATLNAQTGQGLLEYGLYDSAGNVVGNSFSTSSLTDFHIDLPNEPGNYVLKLLKQNFPDSLIRLSGETSIQVMGSGPSRSNRQIALELPKGYQLDDPRAGYVGIIDDLSGYGNTFSIKDGQLTIPAWLDIAPQNSYTLYTSIALKSIGSGKRAVTFAQLQLSGDQLLHLDILPLPADANAYNLKLALPAAMNSIIPTWLMSSKSGGKPFGINTGFMSWQDNNLSLDTIITAEKELTLVLAGYDATNTGYVIPYEISLNPTSGKWSATQRSLGKVQLQDSIPFTQAQWRAERNGYEWTGINSKNDKWLMDKLYMPQGNQQMSFVSYPFTSEETAWQVMWDTRLPVNVTENTTIPFTGKVEAAQSSLTIDQSTSDGLTVLNVKPELVSGNLKLNYLYRTALGYNQQIQAIVTLTNSNGAKLAEGLAGDVGYPFWFSRKLDPGSYTLTYRAPTGPGQEVNLTKSFVVSNQGTGGGGSPDPGPGTGNPDPSNPGTSPGPGGPGGSTNVSGENGDGSSSTKTFKPEDIPAPVNGTVSLAIQGISSVAIPAASILGSDSTKNNLEIASDKASVTIPAAVLDQLKGLLGNNVSLSDAQIQLSLAPIDAKAVVGNIKNPAGNAIKPAATLYEFKLSISGKDGKPLLLTAFNQPITLTFETDPAADKTLSNLFFIAEDGTLTYIPGTWLNGKLTAKVEHFSKYGVLEIKKEFADVSSSSWAYAAVRELAAKLIVGGTTADTFEPNRTVTRAEFTSMLVHALALKMDKTAAFKDVPGTAWYASAVAAAFESGLVKGSSADTFAPSRSITREEMAVIMANALKFADSSATAGQGAAFKDAAKISSWAKEAVSLASANGLIKGDGTGGFNPKGMATRAEAAQMLVNLLNRTAQ